jgi:hypothetical protein
MSSEWRCDHDGAVPPLHVPQHINAEILEAVRDRVRNTPVPLWCPWPLPSGWTVTGVAWAGDDRAVRATALGLSGPCPVEQGPADVVLVAEEPGVGFGTRLAGIPGPDPGPFLDGDLAHAAPHAKLRAAGWPTSMWAVKCPPDRCAYVGEAKGLWLYAVAWPAPAGYLLAEDVTLDDLSDRIPSELVFGAPSPYLHGAA